MTPEISMSAILRLAKQSGADRVGRDAQEEMRRLLEDIAVKVAVLAWEYTKHAHRKTVKADDIRLAFKVVLANATI